MDAEDAAARAYLSALPRREALTARLKEVFYYDALGAPMHRNGRYFWSRKDRNREKSVVLWKEGEAGEPRVLFDPNGWSDDGSISLGGYWPAWDGRRVAYSRKENNSDESITYAMDVATGEPLADVIPGTKYSGASWTPDGSGFYYTWVPPVSDAVSIADRPGHAELRFHLLGSDSSKDPVVFPATQDPSTFLGGFVSRDGRWLFAIVRHGWTSTDVYFRDLTGREAGWTPLVKGEDAIFEVAAWRDHFFVLTNQGAPRYRLFSVRPFQSQRAAWREVVPESDGTLQDAEVIGGKLVLTYLRGAVSALEIREPDGGRVREVTLPGPGTVTGVLGLEDEDQAYFGFTSFTEPTVLYEMSIATGAVKEWARVTLPIDTAAFITEQVHYPSRDGTRVSMFLVRRRDSARDGNNPTLLYGYGGFNVSMTPSFSPSWAVWLENGGLLAIPNLRGGGEYGEAWHRDGMGLKKQNVFDDFIAAARYLAAARWTSPERLAISGGSNGGLLVGAAMTQAPELFKAVVCAVPLLDMLRYHLSGSGKTWISEYGSAEDPEQFRSLHAYSPYHRVRDGVRYPALLMLSADSDDRVDPLHARKFVARVRQATGPEGVALMRIEKNAGHGGADLVKKQVEQAADTYAFLLDQLRGQVDASRRT